MVSRIKETISIIMPVYNVEKYLSRTMNSILGQTYKDFHLYIINDGSTDRSLSMLQKYVLGDNRISVVSQTNKGVAAARNYGIHIAQGDYICFIDADDMWPDDFLESMLHAISAYAVDVVFCGIYKHNRPKTVGGKLSTHQYAIADYVHALYTDKKILSKSACTGIYKADIIDKYCVLFPVGIRCGEDSVFVMRYLLHCKKVMTTSQTVYHYYFDNNESATRYIYYDHYRVEVKRFEIACSICRKNNLQSSKYVSLFQEYYENIVEELTDYVHYAPDSWLAITKHLRTFSAKEVNQMVAKCYTEKKGNLRRSYAYLVLKKCTFLLFLALKIRNFSCREKYKERSRARSVELLRR